MPAKCIDCILDTLTYCELRHVFRHRDQNPAEYHPSTALWMPAPDVSPLL